MLFNDPFILFIMLVGVSYLAYIYLKFLIISKENKNLLKNYITVDNVPDHIKIIAERSRFDPTNFVIPDDLSQPVTPRPYVPVKTLSDGTKEYQFNGPIFVRQLQLIGDYAVRHDGNGGFIFYMKKGSADI